MKSMVGRAIGGRRRRARPVFKAWACGLLLLFVPGGELGLLSQQVPPRPGLPNGRPAGVPPGLQGPGAGVRPAAERELFEKQEDEEALERERLEREGERPAEEARPAPLSAFERQLESYGDPLVGAPVLQFGYEVFGRPQPPLADAPVGGDYVIGTGDSLVISLWGSVDLDYRVAVDREGQVRLPQVGPVALKGLTLERAEEELKRRFDQQFRNYQLQVRLGRLRDMPVHVIGRVNLPGRVRVSSVATLFDALAAAGGVSKDGSLRRLLLRRAGEEDRRIDLYAYLLEGDLGADVSLSASDVIVVPAVGPLVGIAGRVLRPAIYELDGPSISLELLLAMAGGFGRLANRQLLQIESATPSGLSVRTVDLGATPPAEVRLADGDVALVRTASPRLENVVYITGNVALPGRYAFREGLRVSDVLTPEALIDAGFWLERQAPEASAHEGRRIAETLSREAIEEARRRATREGVEAAVPVDARPEPFIDYPEPFLEYAVIRRIDPRSGQETRLPFHLGKAIFDRDPGEDRLLQSQDTIIVFPRSAFEVPQSLYVSGAVNRPGEQRYFPGMRLRDLVRAAGGLLPEAFLESAVLTRFHPDQKGAYFEHIEVALAAVLEGDEDANLLLQPQDALAVKVVPQFRKAFRVRIEGEVSQPGTYTVTPGERLSELLRRAGGFTADAYLPAAQFYRESVRHVQQRRIDDSLQRLELEAKLATQRYTAEAAATGEQVNVQAEQARVERLVATIRTTPAQGRLVLRLLPPDQLAGTANDIELADGDRLVVPRQPQEVHVVGAVFNQTALLYEKKMRARDYLQEVGGPLDSADMGLAYIIRADGSADSAQNARKNFRWDSERGRYGRGDLLGSELHPGDTLVIPYDVKPQLSTLGLTKTITEILFHTALATGVIVALL
jgi:protein involved in polysaccharide export with SLBB domain